MGGAGQPLTTSHATNGCTYLRACCRLLPPAAARGVAADLLSSHGTDEAVR